MIDECKPEPTKLEVVFVIENSGEKSVFKDLASDIMGRIEREYPGSRYGYTKFNDYHCSEYKNCGPGDGHNTPRYFVILNEYILIRYRIYFKSKYLFLFVFLLYIGNNATSLVYHLPQTQPVLYKR